MKPSDESRRLLLLQRAALLALKLHDQTPPLPFRKGAIFPIADLGTASLEQWSTDTTWAWKEAGILERSGNEKRALYRVLRPDLLQKIADDPDVAAFYVSSKRGPGRRYHNSEELLPPQMRTAESFEEMIAPAPAPVPAVYSDTPTDPMVAYIGRTLDVLERMDSRLNDVLKEVKDQSDLVLAAVNRLDGVASRDDVAGAAAELIQAVARVRPAPVDMGRIEAAIDSTRVEMLTVQHTEIRTMQTNVSAALADLGRTFSARMDAQDKRIAELKAPDMKPMESLFRDVSTNINAHLKTREKMSEAQTNYLNHLDEGVAMAKQMVSVAFAMLKSVGASPDEIAETIAAATTKKSLASVGAVLRATEPIRATDTVIASMGEPPMANGHRLSTDSGPEDIKLNRRARRVAKSKGIPI
jgi:hypothetical protein